MTSQAMEPVRENEESCLHKATNPWKPLVLSREVLEPEQSLNRTVNSYLNKLTPERFKTIVSKLQALQIDSEDKLKAVVDLVYEKAVLEPKYSEAYANLCRCLSMFKVPSKTKKDTMVNFRAVLLTRCQRQFEKIGDSKKGTQGTSETGCLDPTEMRKHKGLIRFIGEIFNVKMLTENKIHDMFFKLTRRKKTTNLDCSNLELACVLLTVVGEDLDTTKGMPRMDSYFNFLIKMMGEKKTEPRLRFILQDVIELRMNKWVPRQSVTCTQPTKLAEVRRQMEEFERQENNEKSTSDSACSYKPFQREEMVNASPRRRKQHKQQQQPQQQQIQHQLDEIGVDTKSHSTTGEFDIEEVQTISEKEKNVQQ